MKLKLIAQTLLSASVFFVSTTVLHATVPVSDLAPEDEYILRNVETGLYLTSNATLTPSEQEASNWRVVSSDTVRHSNPAAVHPIHSNAQVLQLYGNFWGTWYVSFTGEGNDCYLTPKADTEGIYKFQFHSTFDSRYLGVSKDAEGKFTLVPSKEDNASSDWEFIPTSRPHSYNYRLMTMKRASGNTQYTLAYRSRDVQGEEVWLSGYMIVPTKGTGGASTADHLLFATHYTMCKNSEVPSNTPPYDSYAFSLARNKPVMIEPDYLGYGITKDREHPYCAPDIMAEESVDMLLASHDLLRDLHGMDCNTGKYPTYGMGYSQGGAIILACQKYVENSPKLTEAQRQAINWTLTCAGAGPYNTFATLSQYIYQDELSMPVAAPLLVIGMVAAYPEIFGDIRAEQYFSDAFNEAKIADKVRSTDYTISELNDAIKTACGATMQGMLSEEAKDMNSDLMQRLLRALSASDLTRGWEPQADIWFFHNQGDDVVPYLNTMSAYNALKEKAKGTCTLYTTATNMSHTAAAIDFMARMIMGGYKN